MSEAESSGRKQYFDLHIQGVGYINRIADVEPVGGTSFLSITISSLWGPVDDVQHTNFVCTVSGRKTQQLVRELKPSVDEGKKVLVGFTLSDLKSDLFTFSKGEKAGQSGIALKSRLLRLSWVRIEGQPFYTANDRKVAEV